MGALKDKVTAMESAGELVPDILLHQIILNIIALENRTESWKEVVLESPRAYGINEESVREYIEVTNAVLFRVNRLGELSSELKFFMDLYKRAEEDLFLEEENVPDQPVKSKISKVDFNNY